MQTNSTYQLPHPLQGVEIRAIGGQKIEDEAVSVFFPPLPMKLGMVVFRVIRDQNHFTPCGGAGYKQFFHEVMKALGVELVRFPSGDKQSIPQPHGPKVSDVFAAREMTNHRVLDFGWNPHPASRTVLLKMNFIKSPQVDLFIPGYGSKFFLYSSCCAESALAITGRIRKPIWRKRRWHCLAPNEIPYFDWMNSDRVLPSQRLVPIPTSNGDRRRASPILRNSSSPRRDGLPGRSRSTSPERPSASKRWTQYSTVRGASPSKRPTSGQLIPCATSNTGWSRWSYRESRDRRISSWRPSTIKSASGIVIFFMPPQYNIPN